MSDISKLLVQQRVVELLAIKDVEAESWLVQHQQLSVNGHDQRDVQLCHMPLDNSLTLLVGLMEVFARKPSALARLNRGCTPAT
jgi:hypothetical protein